MEKKIQNEKKNQNDKQEKKLSELLEKFKELEKTLSDVLDSSEFNFDESTKNSEVKKSLKIYIKKVEKAKKIFQEYEAVATEIEKLSNSNNISSQNLESVVELRKTKTDYEAQVKAPKAEENQASKSKTATKSQRNNKSANKSEYEDKILIDESGVKAIKKKKENSSREF